MDRRRGPAVDRSEDRSQAFVEPGVSGSGRAVVAEGITGGVVMPSVYRQSRVNHRISPRITVPVIPEKKFGMIFLSQNSSHRQPYLMKV